MTAEAVLAIDVGSQSTRAGLVDPKGTLLALTRVAAPAVQAPVPGAAESPAEGFWDGVCASVRDLLAAPGARSVNIKALALCAQRGSTVMCDEQSVPLAPATLWSDQRTCDALPPLPLWLRAGLRLTGAARIVAQLRSRAPGNRWRAEVPALWQRADRVVLLGSWLNFRLTGRWHDSVASQVGYVPLNFPALHWHHGRNWRFEALGGLRPSQLPTLARPGDTIGRLGGDAARAMGLQPGLPVAAAAADKACEVLGAGALDEADEVLSLGTAATVVRPRLRFCDVHRFLPAYPAADPGRFLCETQVACGFARLTAFLSDPSVELPSREPAWATDALARTAPGADGLTATVALSAPSVDPADWLCAALPDRQRVHSPAHQLRALLEALVCELRFTHDGFARRFGAPDRVLLTGGGARSDAVAALVAGIFDRPVLRPTTTESSLLGAAMCAAPAAGWSVSVRDAAATMTPDAQRFAPDDRARADYRALYAERYRPALAALASQLWSAPAGRVRLSP
ncbi:MAG: FGGY family carbohydrate kinase [Pseudomonadota bacterium]